jgi:transposase
MKRKDARSLSAREQESLRFRAVKAVVIYRKKQTEVAEQLGVTRQAVGKWVRTYRREADFEALRRKLQGRPKRGKLVPWQAAEIVKTISDNTPEQLNLPFFLWTREGVAQLIEERFGLQLSIWTIGRYLTSWGFKPSRPVDQYSVKSVKESILWLKEEYPEIRKEAKREKATICWADQTRLYFDYIPDRSFGTRGHIQYIGGTAEQFESTMLSATTNKKRVYFMAAESVVMIKDDLFLEFLKRLVRHSQRKLFIITDNFFVKRSKKIKLWLAENVSQIRAMSLP